ncbi:MAG TPA: glycoside hydrolase family 2 TIM barrel-domain containing protein [Pseudoduganella sp.]|jgi:beta-galactosidase
MTHKFLPAAALVAATIAATFAASAASAEVYAGADQAYTRSLNGNWSFRYVPGHVTDADTGFFLPQPDTRAWQTIAVPSNWELQGFAEPSYGDELKDGMGLYRRTFRVPAGWQDRRVFLRFEGVAFGYQVWVNGQKAGESSASAFNRHTFDVTGLLRQDADNTVAVRVTTRPHGVEFDLNDDWSLSGIYRDVTLFSVPATHVQDVTTTTTLADGAAELLVDVALSRADGEVRARLLAPDGSTAAELVLPGTGELHRAGRLRVAQPKLWTAETPWLYRLQLTVSAGGKPVQAVEERVGLREITIAGDTLLLNGRPVKLRGVNHHDLDPVEGRAIGEARMRADLELMKKANVNFVRTSHYPPNVRLLELCDEMGLYVMDEVSIGHGEKNLDKPEYRANILARVEPTIVRDKNRPSVLVWSIGNENPITEVELEAGRLAKKLDPSRPITYPKIGSYFAANHDRIPAWVDIHAPHYPVNAKVAEYARTLARPTIFTEYAHALGLATDRLQAQWELIQQHPVFAGGAVWHFMDQGILRTSDAAVDPSKPTQQAWLDRHRFYDTHGLDGTDGVTYADRTPQTDYWQMRKVYAPVRFAERSAAVKVGRQQIALTVENRYDFRSLGGMRLLWSLRRNGREVQQGSLPLTAASHGSETVRVPVDVPANAGGDVLALEVRAVDENGLQVNERAVLLEEADGARAGWTGALPAQGRPVASENATEIRVALPQWTLAVQRASGQVTIRDRAGRLLVDGIYPHSGHKPLMAEALRAKQSGLWLSSTLPRLQDAVVKLERQDGNIVVAVSGRYPLPAEAKQKPDAPAAGTPQRVDDLLPGASPAPAAVPADRSAGEPEGLQGGYRLAIGSNGAIAVSYAFVPVHASGLLSEAGLTVAAPAGAGEFRWIGQGPYAGYPGKDVLNEFGLFHLNRADLRFQGNRRGTELALLTGAEGAGFALVMAPGDVAVERDGDRTLVSHNALIGSLGNKGTTPEVTHLAETTARIAGAFTLVPVGSRWPAALVRWFGKPAAAKDVQRPFFHSYDQ